MGHDVREGVEWGERAHNGGGGTGGGGSGGGAGVPDARDASTPSGVGASGGFGDGVEGIKDGSAAAAAVVVIVPSPANAKKPVPPVAVVVVASTVDARTAELRVGYPVDRSNATVERGTVPRQDLKINLGSLGGGGCSIPGSLYTARVAPYQSIIGLGPLNIAR